MHANLLAGIIEGGGERCDKKARVTLPPCKLPRMKSYTCLRMTEKVNCIIFLTLSASGNLRQKYLKSGQLKAENSDLFFEKSLWSTNINHSEVFNVSSWISKVVSYRKSFLSSDHDFELWVCVVI